MGIIIAGLILAIILLSNKINNLYTKVGEQANDMAALTDTLRQHKDNEGRLVSTITSFRGQSAKDFIKIKTKDSTITELQKVVKINEKRIKNTGSATVFTSTTNVDTGAKTKITYSQKDQDSIQRAKKDTGRRIAYIYPIYESDINWGKWGSFHTTSSKDSTHLKGFINNEYSVVVGEDNPPNLFHPFRKATPFSEVTNYNPYSTTKTLRTYQTSLPPPKTWGIGITGGYGGVRANTQIYTGWFIGVGLTKTFIRW